MKVLQTFFMSLLLYFPATAKAITVEVAENDGWVTVYDTDGRVCVATPRSDDGLVFMGSLDGRLDLIFRSPKLAWVSAGKPYPITIYTDRRGWQGTMEGLQNPAGVGLSGAAGEFLAALKAASRMSLEIETVKLGPYSLAGSSKTLETIEACVEAAKSGKFTSPEPVNLPWNDVLAWKKDDYGKSFVSQGWTAVLKGQDNIDGTSTTYLDVKNPQGRSITVKLEGTSGELGAFPFHAGQAPSLYFSAFSGGTHCCTSAVAIVGFGDYPKQIDVGTFDGGGPSPEDIDGDGVFELGTVDQRHLYAFGPYAASLPPPQILALSYEGDKFVDVTAQPKFRGYLRKRFVENYTRYDAAAGDDEEQAAIAGILASASQLNLFPAFRNSMAAKLLGKPADGYDSCVPPECSPEKKFKSLYEMVFDRFGRWGYKTTSTFSVETIALFKDLASHSAFGDKTEGSELSCEMGAYRFKVLETSAISFSGYEFSCDVETAITQADTSLVSAFCSGEGEFSFDHYMFTRMPAGIKVAYWKEDMSGGASDPVEYKPCE